MYWLYFARDFYRCGSAAPAPVVKESRPRHVAKRQTAYVVRSAPDYTPPEEPPVSSGNTRVTFLPPSLMNGTLPYMQRLSVDGDHAFGVWDEEAGFSVFSANFDRVTGLVSGECAGHDWIHAIHHTQQYMVNEALLAALDGQNGQCLVEVRRLKEGATARWLRMDIRAATPRTPQVMVLFCDLTEQKALQEALKKTESALAVSERSRAAFLSSMSHELRTPLNAIMGFSDMMKSAVFGELSNPTYVEYTKHIHESGASLLRKINDLLDIASMDAGGLAIEEEEFCLGEMLSEAIAMQTHHAFARQQQLTLDCPHAIDLLGDRAKLMCATTHLITNALRHSSEGAEISVQVRVQPDEGVILSVRDTGEGIPEAQLEVIRQALVAENAYFSIESGGIGLGLSLTKEIAARHGGRVMLDSMRHRGTVVSMILPAACVTRGMPARRRARQFSEDALK